MVFFVFLLWTAAVHPPKTLIHTKSREQGDGVEVDQGQHQRNRLEWDVLRSPQLVVLQAMTVLPV